MYIFQHNSSLKAYKMKYTIFQKVLLYKQVRKHSNWSKNDLVLDFARSAILSFEDVLEEKQKDSVCQFIE